MTAFAVLVPQPARAYLYTTVAGNQLMRWNDSSRNTIWDKSSTTLSWSFNSLNFPQPNWPTASQAGAAFQNSYQSLQDTNPLGTSIKFKRLPDTNSVPRSGDGVLQMSLCPNATPDYFGTNLATSSTVAFAITYVLYDTTTGAIEDADIVFNGDSRYFNWSTTDSAPTGTNDIEVTSVHEQMHSIGAGHPIYYYAAVWPVGRYPELLMFDRCLGPDDRMLIRTLYPSAPTFSTITGTVTNASGGAPINLAVVVATDGNGIPQATVVTDTNGAYTVNVPAGTNYSITAHNWFNSTYNSDIPFLGNSAAMPPIPPATGFVNSGTRNGVNASATITNQNFTVTAGTPTMTLSRLALSSVANLTNFNATQTQFLPKGSTTNLKLEFTGAVGDGPIAAVDMGPGIVVTTGATTASNNTSHVVCAVTAAVGAGATPGVRNISCTRGSERLFLPGYIEVTDTGGLTVTTGTQNPAPGSAPFSAVNRPLLQLNLTASPVEDIRIRTLQFGLAGAGPALPLVHLWLDGGATPGVVDGTDTPIFSGAAYANATVSDTIAATPPGTIVFDNLALTIPAGTTRTLLLTADMPASGSGSYSASFDPTTAANITAHGMYWGDVCTPGGSTVTGGTQSVGFLAVGNLGQIHTTAPQNVIPVGGSTDETQITLRGTVTSPTGTLGLEVEAKPVGTAFTGTATFTTPATSPSGTQLSINVTGLASGTAYHWQARALSSASAPSGWVSFGANAETAADFTCDTSVTGAPTGLMQFEADGVTVIPVGGRTPGFAKLQANGGTNNQGFPISVEIEVQPTGTAFTGTTQYSTGFGPTGTPQKITFSGPMTDYHWQARSATQFGSRSGFTNFNAAAIHFHLDAIPTIKANAGCVGKASESHDGGWMLWTAAGATLLLLSLLRAAGRKIAAGLVLLFCIGAAAEAAEDPPLPRTLAESFEGPAPGVEGLMEPGPPFAQAKEFMTVDAYLGMIFMDMNFKALGTDFINREVSGMGAGVLGVEALIDILPDWRVGLAAEVAMWGDIRVIAVGPVGTWCFSGSRGDAASGVTDMQHFLKLAVFYEKLSVTKTNFGNFDASFGARLGYELRIALGDRWALMLDAGLQYSQWKYSPAVLGGDDTIGGFGGLLSVGLAWLP